MATRLLREVRLRPEHRPTGKTRHSIHGADFPPTTTLRIVQYDGDPGYFLLHIDKDGGEGADTWHQTLDEAMQQANREFQVKREDWRSIED
ncbi:MAG TPA: hypothetical protein VGF95_12045 [Solirubrobacteraceae bacterium]|jgi:hypothetical protein